MGQSGNCERFDAGMNKQTKFEVNATHVRDIKWNIGLNITGKTWTSNINIKNIKNK